MEVFSKPSNKPMSLGWLVGISSGTTTENLNEGKGIASVHGKVWANLAPDLRLSASGYYVDHSDNPATGPGSTKGSLFSGRRSGGVYGGVLGGGNAPGEVLPGQDQLVTAVQADVSYTPRPWEIYGNLGWMQDEDPNGSGPGEPSESWTYGMFEVDYYFHPRIYVAGRYSFAAANVIAGNTSNGYVQRFQIGGGYWVTRNMLAKLEGVYQTYNEFNIEDGLVSGVDAYRGPEFYGIIAEVSFAF
jgi:predicted porin